MLHFNLAIGMKQHRNCSMEKCGETGCLMRSKRPRGAGAQARNCEASKLIHTPNFGPVPPATLGRFDLIRHPVSPHFFIGQFCEALKLIRRPKDPLQLIWAQQHGHTVEPRQSILYDDTSYNSIVWKLHRCVRKVR